MNRIRGRKLRQRRKTPERRLNSAERGYDHRWRSARRRFLMRPENVFCRRCDREFGRLVEAECVDHIIPHRNDPKLFWNKSNWQPLCNRCHSIKTASEDGGFGNKRKGRTE